MWSVRLVFPEASGPYISTTRLRGTPPTPNALSSEIEPVEITEIPFKAPACPSFIIDPLPNCFSI